MPSSPLRSSCHLPRPTAQRTKSLVVVFVINPRHCSGLQAQMRSDRSIDQSLTQTPCVDTIELQSQSRSVRQSGCRRTCQLRVRTQEFEVKRHQATRLEHYLNSFLYTNSKSMKINSCKVERLCCSSYHSPRFPWYSSYGCPPGARRSFCLRKCRTIQGSTQWYPT